MNDDASESRQLTAPLACLLCGTAPERALPADFGGDVQPYGATTFTTRGHYGSTCIDEPADGHRLAVNICESCLHKAAAQGRVASQQDLSRSVEVGGLTYSRHHTVHLRWDGNDHRHAS